MVNTIVLFPLIIVEYSVVSKLDVGNCRTSINLGVLVAVILFNFSLLSVIVYFSLAFG